MGCQISTKSKLEYTAVEWNNKKFIVYLQHVNIMASPRTKEEVNKILITGAYGTKNLGDEKLLSAISQLCRERYDPVEIVAASIRPQETAQRKNVDTVVYTLERNPIQWLRTVKDTDLILFGGGSTLGGPFSRRHSLIVAISQFFNADLYTIATGIYQGYNIFDTILLRLYLRAIDGITVRDRDTKETLRNMGITGPIEIVPDPGFLPELKTSSNNEHIIPGEYILVCGNDLSDIENSEISVSLDRINRKFEEQIIFFPFNRAEPHSDLAFSRKVMKEMKTEAEIFQDCYNICEAESIIKDANAVIAVRLHSMILSAQCRTPFTPISYNRKCDALLDRLGLEGYLHHNNIEKEKLIDSIEANIENDEPTSMIEPVVAQLQDECQNILPSCESQSRDRNIIAIFGLILVIPIVIITNLYTYLKSS